MTEQQEITGIRSFTAGTLPYTIPLKPRYILKERFPLEFTECWDGSYVIFCPVFDEYGCGEDYQAALSDLGDSIVDFWLTLRRLIKRKRNLGNDLRRILELMEETITKEVTK